MFRFFNVEFAKNPVFSRMLAPGSSDFLFPCPASRGETVEQACMVHGVDPDELLAQVNAMIDAQ